MLEAFLNIWKVAELRTKILFTLGMLAIYRIGYFIPLPGVNQESLREWAEKQSGSAAGNFVAFIGMFTGGTLGHSTIFGLGIMPYISSAIIFQLLATVWPTLVDLKKEGATGYQKITEWTRYATVPLCLIQGIVWMKVMVSSQLVYPQFTEYPNIIFFWLAGLLGLTAGTIFLMWLGEQVDKYGIGNGVSLIITAGIVARMPQAIRWVADNFSLSSNAGTDKPLGIGAVIMLAAAFVTVVAGAIIITQGQRRIPIQQAKHTRGRRVYGGQKSYLPLRVNHGGVMPIIFASAMMMFPTLVISYIRGAFPSSGFVAFMDRNIHMGQYPYELIFIVLIYFFAYFWTTVQFQPKEMATQLRDHGSFIPGLRPGPRTAEYLETVMERITYVGAGFLAIIAVVPSVVAGAFKIDWVVASFLGGTGLLIVVSVMLDFVQRIEANLMMRNYSGFLGGSSGGGKGTRIRGAR
ncbi:MAG: preprotein translocase subunit SecY [Phycisphaera sp.]|nr:preprotein translocase subunit SecY [Phycisphaera sp.]